MALGFLKQTLIGVAALLSAQAQAAPVNEDSLLLKVDDLEVSAGAFMGLAAQESRTRFYHFTPPPDEKEAFYRELVDRLIDEKLLREEAERRDLVPDGDYIIQRLVAAERRFKGDPEVWEQQLAETTERLRGQALILALKEAEDAKVAPDQEAVRAYYDANRELFVEPPRYRVGLILLAVPPWEREATWQQTEEEAKALYDSLQEGADFADLARKFSDDPTAEDGGDMGYLHEGMLGDQVEEAVAELEEVGDISEPFRVLEGVVIVKLLGKQDEQQRTFEEVSERAESLLVRELQDERWESLKSQLREESDIQFKEALFTEILER